MYICICIYVRIFFLPKVHSPNHETDVNARWLKRRGLSQGSALQASVFRNFHFSGVIPPQTSKISPPVRKIPAKSKKNG